MIEFIARRTPSCQEMAALFSESMDRTLSWPIRVKMRLHLSICQGCRTYRAQLQSLRQAMRRQAMASDADAEPLAKQAQDRLKDAFRSSRR